ncbi:MAG: hypothetical protein R2839_00200 [Thermomicrobiales bacterium]
MGLPRTTLVPALFPWKSYVQTRSPLPAGILAASTLPDQDIR